MFSFKMLIIRSANERKIAAVVFFNFENMAVYDAIVESKSVIGAAIDRCSHTACYKGNLLNP